MDPTEESKGLATFSTSTPSTSEGDLVATVAALGGARAHERRRSCSSSNNNKRSPLWRAAVPQKFNFTNDDDDARKHKQLVKDLNQLARTVRLLRAYETRFGMPTTAASPLLIVQTLCQRLYASGVPIWVLEPVMKDASAGLSLNVGFFLLPSSGIILPNNQDNDTASTRVRFFRMERDFCMYQMTLLEKVLDGLVSYTKSALDDHAMTLTALRECALFVNEQWEHEDAIIAQMDRQELTNEILDSSARGFGLVSLTHIEDSLAGEGREELSDQQDVYSNNIDCSVLEDKIDLEEIHAFWSLTPSSRELFTRLATQEAVVSMQAIEQLPNRDTLYSRFWIVLGRALGSAGSSGLWFHGSWIDMLISGLLAGLVAFLFQTNSQGLWYRNRRMIFEVIVGFVVGLSAGLISISWPQETCFDAIAIPSMIDYLRGFGIVFSTMEVMSRNTMSGSADYIEAIIFSFLISVSIIVGLYMAEFLMGIDDSNDKKYMDCVLPVDELWFLLILPVASIGWAIFFRPRYSDLPIMSFHAVISFAIQWGIEYKSENSYLSSFVAAFAVAALAGSLSRFTGRQALGNTFTGLYTLVPGIFIVDGFFSFLRDEEGADLSFMVAMLCKASLIGVGAWIGSLVSSPDSRVTNGSGLLPNGKARTMLYI